MELRRKGKKAETTESAPTTKPVAEGRGKLTTAELLERNKGPGVVKTTFRTLVGLAIVAAIGTGVFFAADALDDEPVRTAPYGDTTAPPVSPDPLENQ